MKKIKNRAISAMLIVAAIIVGLGLFTVKLALNGGKWAAFAANISSERAIGVLVDRNGVELAGIRDGIRFFAEDEVLRRSVLHSVGDSAGKIGTGAIKIFADKLIGYNFITGAYSRTGEGETVTLSIDSNLNLAAYNALGNRNGAVVVTNYETGEVLCMVSTPTFDPNNPTAFSEDDPKFEGVYINRALSAAYTPGSVFKLVTTAAALENIPDINDRVFECTGSLKVGESAVTCGDAHGLLTLEDALAESCNTTFAQLALELGAEVLERYTTGFGLIEKLPVNGIFTVNGRFDKGNDDSPELAWSGVGQYNNAVTLAAIVRFSAAIANGGIAHDITLLAKGGFSLPASGSRIIKKETAERLSEIMNYNVIKKYGADNFPGLELQAKSGTAEVGVDKEPHAWFTGFIKNESYPLAFAVIVENGGNGSSVAGTVANKVIKTAVS